jgi:hypothetical protein
MCKIGYSATSISDESLQLVPKCLKNFILMAVSRDSVVGIATNYGLDDQDVAVRDPVV